MVLKNSSNYGLSILVITLGLILTQTVFVSNPPAFSQTSAFSIASTRGFFDLDSGERLQPPTGEFLDISEILDLNNSGCPGELSIYVHGVWADEDHAREQAERVFLSLQDNGYDIPVIGYSWDSNTSFSPTDLDITLAGWNVAKEIANGNGELLAQLILDFKESCENDDVRIIAHSLGSRVTLAALQFLHTDPEWTNNLNNEIKSVHLLGAAIDNEQVSTIPSDCSNNDPSLPCSGEAIEAEVERFFNLYNPEDNMLQYAYNSVEGDSALGWCGEEGGFQWIALWWCFVGTGVGEPENYDEYGVINELPSNIDSNNNGECDVQNSDGLCTILLAGDNHYGYLGYRSSSTTISNNGAIDRVIEDWEEQG